MKIKSVDKEGVAFELGIQVGEELLGFEGKFDDKNGCDFLDYQYYNGQESFVMTVLDSSGSVVDYEIEKYANEDLGLDFFDEIVIKRCVNKCIFCFIDQLPKKETVRRTLLVKDDDYRLSTMCGNFVTLTNLQERDIARIKQYKLSPMYVSVHSTDDVVRRKLLGNPKALPILPLIEQLHNSGIVVHAQIVYCPTYNEDYQKTIQDLSQYCMSVAIVPVGLTNDCNKDLHPVTKEIACRLIAEIGVLQQQFLETQKRRFAYLADEIYVTAGVALPNPLEYDHFEQTGNGVGLMAQFDIEVQDALQNVTAQKTPPYKYTIVTGMASYQYFCDLQKRLVQRGLSVEVKGVVNHYFGNRVTVAGLVTGSDIVKAYEGHTFDKNERLLLPKNMLKEFGDVFLDDMSLQQLQDLLGVQIEMVQVDGHALIEKLQS